jgi:hypothetical protein
MNRRKNTRSACDPCRKTKPKRLQHKCIGDAEAKFQDDLEKHFLENFRHHALNFRAENIDFKEFGNLESSSHQLQSEEICGIADEISSYSPNSTLFSDEDDDLSVKSGPQTPMNISQVSIILEFEIIDPLFLYRNNFSPDCNSSNSLCDDQKMLCEDNNRHLDIIAYFDHIEEHRDIRFCDDQTFGISILEGVDNSVILS